MAVIYVCLSHGEFASIAYYKWAPSMWIKLDDAIATPIKPKSPQKGSNAGRRRKFGIAFA